MLQPLRIFAAVAASANSRYSGQPHAPNCGGAQHPELPHGSRVRRQQESVPDQLILSAGTVYPVIDSRNKISFLEFLAGSIKARE